MLKLEKIRAVFFDFDDTLCIHSLHEDWKYQFNQNTTIDIFDHFGCKPNEQMKKFVEILVNLNVEMHLISASEENVRPVKLKWVKEHYGVNMIDSCTLFHADKANKMKEYCRINNIQCGELLFVDDIYCNLKDATKIGIQACSPMEIVNFVNHQDSSCQKKIVIN